MAKQHQHAKLIDALGGGSVVASELWGGRLGKDDRRVESVYKWKKNGIPWRWRPEVARLANAKGLPLPPDFLLAGHDLVPRALAPNTAPATA